jgi:Na+-transporting NADH:ubiquinone oxidoreductase subunit NqrC
MVGIDFTDQVETPGLGARILEQEFKYFFRNMDLSGFTSGDPAPIIMVRQKQSTNVQQSSNSLQAITGATQTIDGVLNMVNTDLKFYIDVLKTNEKTIKEQVL